MSLKSLNDIKLFVSSLMTEIQDEHSKLVSSLREKIGQTKEFEDTLKVLSQIYDAKIGLLDKIYKEIE